MNERVDTNRSIFNCKHGMGGAEQCVHGCHGPKRESSIVATEEDEQRGSAVARLIHAMRHADTRFEKVGGTTRHYVRDCLIPEMQEQHIGVYDTDEIERLQSENYELRRCSGYERPSDRRCVKTKDDGHKVCIYE